ncbi:hypothetical protein CKK33_04955 [Mucilaginibacter sp. MD40]|uniref:hypothetical protein n=1 Tax=Mucilaginibacter sp. MD40 TaxID=2029590 RepID=UPI000BAC8D42|nr:hypothetical protein [Mucilaginibacter sp. MD40]PAW92872.1 hypothetical protein CKK33_04955 [Mucilaginibacter sp. MD40]
MTKKAIGLLLLICTSLLHLSAQARTIQLAGLVVDSQTLNPISTADIYDDETHRLIGSTNTEGYYHISINYNKPSDIRFKLRVVKSGYKAFTQTEHWGNLSNGAASLMYFGLQQKLGAAPAFSSLGDKGNGITYEQVLQGFIKVRESRVLETQLAHARQGNQKVFIQLDDAAYLLSNSGWIKLNSADDKVRVDDKIVAANQLNDALKRGQIKWMSPVDEQHAKFAIRTK